MLVNLQSSLSILRDRFDGYGKQYVDLRCVWTHWPRWRRVSTNKQDNSVSSVEPYPIDVEPIVNRAVRNNVDDRPSIQFEYGDFVNERDIGGGEYHGHILAFYGDVTGAKRFMDLAGSAGGCVPANLSASSGLAANVPGASTSAYTWCRTLFERAIGCTTGSALRVDHARALLPDELNHDDRHPKADAFLSYSVLTVDPFIASCFLIDELLADEGKDELPDDGLEEKTARQVEPLTDNEQAVYDLISQQPPGKGIQGKAILRMLDQQGMTLDETDFRKRIIKRLKRDFGVENRRGVGYYCDSDIDPTKNPH